MFKILSLLILSTLTLSSKASKKDTPMYLAQFDTKGVSGTISVNGITMLRRDGSNNESGGGALNAFLRPGKNIIAVNLKAVSGTPSFRVIIGTREKDEWKAGTDEKSKLPLQQEVILQLPDFPKTPLWSSLPVTGDPAPEITATLIDLRKKLITAAEKRDFKGLAELLYPKYENLMLSLGASPSREEFADQLSGMFDKETKIKEPASFNQSDLVISSVPGSNLYSVERKDGRPLSLIELGGPAIGIMNAIVGKTPAGWQVLAEN